MARPRSEKKRDAIVQAAIRTIAAHGLGASTAAIAKEAGVSNGALFTYFDTKIELLNQLYVELKMRMAALTAVADLPGVDARDQMLYVWQGLLRWGANYPDERRALAQLNVSNDLTAASRRLASKPYAHVEALLDRCRSNGSMRDAPLMFVAAIVMALVDATIDYIATDDANAEKHAISGFDAMWRAIT